MSDFRPGVAATRKALGDAVRIVEKPHPGGQKGANLSLREIAIRLREGKEDGRVGAWASRTFNRNGRPKTHRAKAQVLLDEFRKSFAYHPDPIGTEAIKGAAQTMCLDDKGLCFEGGDCDDLCVALGSACMTLGIPVRVLAQAFDDADIPSHVLFEIQTEQGEWLPVDPSSDSMRVGRKFPAKKEWRLDPMKDLEDVVGASGPSGGNFVGIGAGPGMGAEPSSEFQRMTSAELSEYLKTLELQVDSLGIAIDEVEKVRRIARPNSPYDVEFLVNETLDVSKFPTDGSLWTKGMSVVCTDMYLTGREMVRMGYQALEGKRKVLVDDKTGEVVFEGLTGDPWSLKTVTQSTTDAVFAFFGVNGTLLEGFTQKTGRVLSPNEVKGAAQAAGGTVQGVGWVFLAVIGAAAVAGLAALAIVAYGKHCDMAKDAARQASYQTLINCQREGKCSEAAVKQGLAIIADANIKTDEAAARKEEAADPYGLKALGKILMWVVIGGAAAAAVVTFSPVVRRAAEGALEDKEAKRKATAAASSGPPRLPSPPPRHPAMSRALLPARRAT